MQKYQHQLGINYKQKFCGICLKSDKLFEKCKNKKVAPHYITHDEVLIKFLHKLNFQVVQIKINVPKMNKVSLFYILYDK